MRVLGLKDLLSLLLVTGLLVIAGCGGGGGDDAADQPPPVGSTPPDPVPAPAPTPQPDPDPGPDPDPDPTPVPEPSYKNLFTPVSDATWDETAVRKVLHIFAFGGQTTDQQISTWADMAPEYAIAEMLNFNQHNLRLSTPSADDTDGLAARSGKLRDLAVFWASDDPANGVPAERRELYEITNFSGSLPTVWKRAATSRGLNPFRAKIGFWETNYHMAVNMATSVPRVPLLRYYEDIMEAHEQDRPYQEVMGVAAASAAIALQYGHRTNRFRHGVCDCNEDFAREYHQLFFGILGSGDSHYHETVTIKNTAKALTDMTVHSDDVAGVSDFVEFGTYYHPDTPLEILGQMVNGTNAAERIAEMVEVSIEHPESLDNLPVMIVSDLADDNLDSRKISAIRNAWRAMPEKKLLDFLRGYAISTIFHDPSRVKFMTSFDRHLLFTNLSSTSNEDNYLEMYWPQFTHESVQVFMPTHNVFGSQKGTEAAASDLVFRTNMNLSTESVWRLRATSGERFGEPWQRDWSRIVPTNTAGDYVVREVAAWLWQRYVADGYKNFGPLERAHLYALLAADRDLAFVTDDSDLERIMTTDDVLTDVHVIGPVAELSTQTMALGSSNQDDRENANRRLGMAMNFILASPYVFAQEGR